MADGKGHSASGGILLTVRAEILEPQEDLIEDVLGAEPLGEHGFAPVDEERQRQREDMQISLDAGEPVVTSSSGSEEDLARKRYEHDDTGSPCGECRRVARNRGAGLGPWFLHLLCLFTFFLMCGASLEANIDSPDFEVQEKVLVAYKSGGFVSGRISKVMNADVEIGSEWGGNCCQEMEPEDIRSNSQLAPPSWLSHSNGGRGIALWSL